MIQIPLFQDVSADFTQEIELNGQLIQLRIVYNIRVDFFFLRFTDQLGNPIQGIKIVPNWLLLDSHKGFVDFDGDLIVIKTDENAGNEITYDNFGNGWDLFYLTPDEAEEWRTENGF